MRDDFPPYIQRTLAARVGHRCSNPTCRAQTQGPRSAPEASVNIGVAAHITAAAPRGPRYDPALSPARRRAAGNGIHLCQNCAKLIDNDPDRYSADVLQTWKRNAEAEADRSLGRPRSGRRRDGSQRADLKLFSGFLKALPYEGCITFLEKQNMAGWSFDPRRLADLDLFFREWRDATHEFHDERLEEARKHLHDLVRKYLGFVALNTWPTHNGQQTVPPEWEHEQPDRFIEVVDTLHSLAGEIVSTHQELVRLGRRILGV
jgi:hypothetical protein